MFAEIFLVTVTSPVSVKSMFHSYDPTVPDLNWNSVLLLSTPTIQFCGVHHVVDPFVAFKDWPVSGPG